MSDPLRVVLVSTRNPLNIGAAARALSNFGFTHLRLVNPYNVAFEEARSAIGSRYILEQAEVFESVAAAVSDCALVVGTTSANRRDLHIPLYRLEAAAGIMRERWASSPVSLLFGSEKFGLSNEDLSHCHLALRIPTREEHGSMNLGQAVAICLYELRREPEAARKRFAPQASATAEQYERLTELLADALAESGYIKERTSASSELKLRRLVRRLGLPGADVETWLGIYRQFLWKLKQRTPAS